MRVTLKRLFASVALIAVGIQIIVIVVRWGHYYDHLLGTAAVGALGLALIGAGIFCPAKRTIE